MLAVETSRLCHGGRKSKLSQHSVTSVKCILCVVRFSKCCRLTAVGILGVYVLGAVPSSQEAGRELGKWLLHGFHLTFGGQFESRPLLTQVASVSKTYRTPGK